MSEVRLTIRDAQRDIHGTCHGLVADAAVAALAAEPETIDELDTAMQRFIHAGEWSFFRSFRPGVNDEPYDAGIVIIDLAARLIAYESTYSAPSAEGSVRYHNGKCGTSVELKYRLPDGWQITKGIEAWDLHADRRRKERAANPPLDARAVLYGRPLLDFVIAECLARCEPEPDDDDVPRQIHVKWLMTPRDDLRGQAPRDVLLVRHDWIQRDLHWRCMQWSDLLECPRGIDPDSHAFRYAAFGTHEIVEYYNLVRMLIEECRGRLMSEPRTGSQEDFHAAEAERLEQVRDEWLDSPDPELHGMTPRQIIDHERSRLPEGMSGHDAIVDHNCPTCQFMAELPGPTFWHLDGSGMDDEFAFSFKRTREEWDAERREWDEFDRKYNARKEEQRRLVGDDPWKHGFVRADDPGRPPEVRAYAVAEAVAEMIVELAGDETLVDRLRGDFTAIREVAESPYATEEQLESVVARLDTSLTAVAAARPELQGDCAELAETLQQFAHPQEFEPPQEFDPSSEDGDDAPY